MFRFKLPYLCCLFLLAGACSVNTHHHSKPTVYYVDAVNGADSNSGLSPENAWKSLAKINKFTFSGGDSLLLKAGTSYTGVLKPKRTPTENQAALLPITIDKYGEGPKPAIHAQGRHVAAVYLHNTEGWHVRNLALTNKGDKPRPSRNGIWVHNQTLDTVRDIKIEYLDIANVYGTTPKSLTAGTAINVTVDRKQRRRFDGLTISHNHIKNSQRNGIILRGAWQRENRYASINVIISHNLIEGVGGDGIIIGGSDGALVEWNTVRQHPDLGEEGGAAAGIWPFSSDNTLIQFNDVSGQKSWVDAQAYDSDYNSRNNTFQYNLSRNNRGGFMLLCSPNDARRNDHSLTLNTTVKFNLSIDDGYRATDGKKHYFSPALHITGGGVRNNDISNNIFIVSKKPQAQMDRRIIGLGNWGGQYPSDTRFNGNIVWAKPGHTISHDHTHANSMSYANNQFFGAVDKLVSQQEVALSNNSYHPANDQIEVKLAGTQQQLEIFKAFLAAKGNPHEAAGMKILWP